MISMSFIVGIRVLILFISVIIFFGLLIFERTSKEHHLLTVSMPFFLCYNVVCVWELYHQSQDALIITGRLKGYFIWCTITILMLLVIRYSRLNAPKWITPFLAVCLIIYSTFLFKAPRMSEYYFSTLITKTVNGTGLPFIHYGILGEIYHYVLAIFSIVFTGYSIYCNRQQASSNIERKQKLRLLHIISTVALFSVLEIILPDIPFDLAQIGLTLSCIKVVHTVYHYHLMDLISGTKDTILDSIDDGVLMLDENFYMLYENNSAKKIFRPLLTEEIPVNYSSIFPLLKKDSFVINDRVYESRITELFNNKKSSGYSIIIHDITEHHMYSQELLRLKEQADEENRSKTNFLTNVSHELRTSMNAIIGMSELSLRQNLPDNLKHNLEHIYHFGKDLLTIINRVLDISKAESGRMTLHEADYQLDNVIYETANITVHNLHDKPVSFKVYLQDHLPNGYFGDVTLIKEILLNLLGNSAKYTDEGSIILMVNYEPVENQDDKVLLKIVLDDSGCGIPEDKLDDIFNIYEQAEAPTNPNIVSTGLGLSITKQILELMGGTISVESVYGMGSRFTVTIPQKVTDFSYVPFNILHGDDIKNQSHFSYTYKPNEYIYPDAKILVLDDIEVNLEVASGLLEPYKVNVTCVSNTYEAEKLIRKNHYDLVFTDHMMPDKNGVEFTKDLRNSDSDYLKNLPIVALTANAIAGSKEFFIANGFSDFLSKPISVSRLDIILKKWLPDTLRKPNDAILSDTISLSDNNPVCLIDGINWQEGLRNNGNNIAAYKKVLSSYTREVSKLLEDLWHYARLDLEKYATKVHGIRGSSRIIGATKVAEFAGELENAAKSGHQDTVLNRQMDFVDLVKKQISDILHYLEQENDTKEAALSNKENQLTLNKEWWLSLKTALENYNTDEAELMLKEAATSVTIPSQLNQIKNVTDYVEDFEYDKAIEYINTYITSFFL